MFRTVRNSVTNQWEVVHVLDTFPTKEEAELKTANYIEWGIPMTAEMEQLLDLLNAESFELYTPRPGPEWFMKVRSLLMKIKENFNAK